jgi:outer membrane biosynthesis protein TonB
VEVAAGGGAGEDPEVVAGSGNVSLDESGRRAVEATRDLPPLPEKYSGGISATFEFACKDIR